MALKTFFLLVVLGIVATISVAVPAEDGVPSVAKSEAVREVGEFETSIRPRCKKYEYIYCKKCHKVKKCIKYSYGKCTKYIWERVCKKVICGKKCIKYY